MGTEPDQRSPLERFLDVFWKDVEANAVRPLAEYLARFPGDDTGIGAEYAAILRGRRDGGTTDTELGVASAPTAQRIGPYRIIRELGRGGQGTVYLAEDVRLGRTVALKVLDPGPTTSKAAIERFRREATITSKLDHPGICPVYDVGTHNGASFIAMRYVEGDALARRITTARERATPETTFVCLDQGDTETVGTDGTHYGPPTAADPTHEIEIDRVLRLIEQAARALHVAHEHGVIHRDIKPGNIMVMPDGQPMILDFGLAQETDSDLPTLTQTGDFFGTPAYMSPEQLLAQRIRLDRRTDVWSLGVTLFECLTLQRPFDAPTREGLYQAIQAKDPPDLRTLNRRVSRDLRVVVATALEKDRDRRYATAEALADDLRRVRLHEPILARPVGPVVRLGRWCQRNPMQAVAVITVLTALGVTAYLLMEARVESDAKDAALTEKSVALRLAESEAIVGTTINIISQQAIGAFGDPTRRAALERAAGPLLDPTSSRAAPPTDDSIVVESGSHRVRLASIVRPYDERFIVPSDAPLTSLADPFTASFSLAIMLKSEQRYGESLRYYDAIIPAARSKLRQPHWLLAALLVGSSGDLIHLKRFDDAERRALEGYDVARAAMGPRGQFTVNASAALVRVYEAWGKPARATEWRQRIGTEDRPAAFAPAESSGR